MTLEPSRPWTLSLLAALALAACGGHAEVPAPDAAAADATSDAEGDAKAPSDSGAPDSSQACEPWTPGGDPEPPWATGCPDAGCPTGTTCVGAAAPIGPYAAPIGCAPVPASCAGTPTCACMGCVCGGTPPIGGCSDTPAMMPNGPTVSLVCQTGATSRRAFKDDVVYVDDAEREALAAQAEGIRLARYRYKSEPKDARRRLGFLIDDQPEPSPAVDADRTHVDEYGYTSMLLAAVQQQAKEIAALQERVQLLEGGRGRKGSERRKPK